MKKRELKVARGYNPKTQARVGIFAAQLDDQLAKLKRVTANLTVEQLQWQHRPGMNTIGMLMAHQAINEVWWVNVAPAEIPWDPQGMAMIRNICEIEDDGLPLPPDGKHPAYLDGFTVEKYLTVLERAHRSIHKELKRWLDKDIDKFYKLGRDRVTRAWTLYHALEHFSGHLGQILVLKHLMRDAGVLEKDK